MSFWGKNRKIDNRQSWEGEPDKFSSGKMWNFKQAECDNQYTNEMRLDAQKGAGDIDQHSLENDGYFYFFIITEEFNPLSGKVIRRVMINPNLSYTMSAIESVSLDNLNNPEKFGFYADNNSTTSLARHVEGQTPTPFISASKKLPFGATRYTGKPYWIDIEKAKTAGAVFYTQEEIVEDLLRMKDKMKDAGSKERIEQLIKTTVEDKEVLIRNDVPYYAVEGRLTIGLKTSVKVVQVVGFVISAVDMKHAIDDSVEQKSFKPVIKETVKQSGGWTGAWAGMRLGAVAGAAVGIETGPGAIATGLGGAVVGGFLGYRGGSWISDHF